MSRANNTSSYLEEDPSATTVERRRELKGYELYLVEQWACSRKDPTFVIVNYTGDPSHSVLVSVLSIPTDESVWSPRLRLYFAAASKYKGRRRETPLGILMVTNLSWFPSALTVVLVPDGDVKKHREDLIVNEDLKRLGCSGRGGLSLAPPSDATRTKFYQQYKISDQIPLFGAVIELVKLCQVALVLFDKLEPSYADGLLCDVTEQAINVWWTELGTDFFDFEPYDGVLGPTTVAALIGLLTGARNRLNVYGAPVAKDPFDLDNLKNGIAHFQKSQKLAQTRRLDRQTIQRLQRATAKAAQGEGWTVPRAVKSTMAELSGKGGEMVISRVAGREKAGIADVETVDLERFVQLVRGERCKWLWYGRPRRTAERGEVERPAAADGETASKPETGRDTPRRSMEGTATRANLETTDQAEASADSPISASNEAFGDRDSQLRRAVLRTVASRKNEALSGLGKIKDAVGLSAIRGRHQQLQKEDFPVVERGRSPIKSWAMDGTESARRRRLLLPVSSDAGTDPDAERSTKPTPIRMTMEAFRRKREAEEARVGLSHSTAMSRSSSMPTESRGSPAEPERISGPSTRKGSEDSGKGEGSDEESAHPCRDRGQRDAKAASLLLRRTTSLPRLEDLLGSRRNSNRWPRHLSFSGAEDIVLAWDDITEPGDEPTDDVAAAYKREYCMAETARRSYAHVLDMQNHMACWVEQRLGNIESLELEADQDREVMDTSYALCAKEYQTMTTRLGRLLPDQRASLMESVRNVGVLGAKLDYELNNLVTKVEDVEDAVESIERHVYSLELKAQDFAEDDAAEESWWMWLVRMVAGIGR